MTRAIAIRNPEDFDPQLFALMSVALFLTAALAWASIGSAAR